jgi:hypothetical protein|nr:MAG TPA: hypothetical protein [Caudoviricetes sp.]
MALSITDVIALANAGFSKNDIAAFMNLGTDQNAPPATPTAPSPAPVPAPAPITTPHAPAVPDYAAQLAALTAKIDALSVPNAGTVGNPPTVTSVDDIIRAAVLPKPAEGAPTKQ